jgi:putative DNA primase/helicase
VSLRPLAEQYLRSRSIEVPDEACQALAFHPACPWDGLKNAPCLVALIRDIITSEPVGIHRTALTADGRKIGRKALGPKSGGAIKLSPELITELAIGEGIETTLSAMQLGFGPALGSDRRGRHEPISCSSRHQAADAAHRQ